jgi:hypothetical protein
VSSTDDEQLGRLCEVLNAHHVVYVIFGSFAGRLQGADLHTVVDIVPDRSEDNLQRLCDALNSLSPRWRVDDVSEGLRIDGGRLEPRHILGSSIALGLVTSAGLIDIVLEPAGFERGYDDLSWHAVTVDVAGNRVKIGSIDDLIRPKEILGREKDREHLADLRARQAELDLERNKHLDRGDDLGLGL